MYTISCLVLLVAAAMAQQKPYYNLEDGPVLFEKFIQDYNKHYKDDADRARHYEAFMKSLEVINSANAKPGSAVFDINHLADYTPEESQNLYGVKDTSNRK